MFPQLLRLRLFLPVVTLLLSQRPSSTAKQERARIRALPQNCANGFWQPRICPKDDTQDISPYSVFRLVKLNGVKVGHVREMNLTESKIHRVVTRSLRPLLFEIPDFLSHKECDLFIQLTQERHLADSETIFGRGEGIDRAEFERKLTRKNLTFERKVFCTSLERPCNDLNSDGKISVQEFVEYIDYEKHIHPTKEDASPMFGLLDLDSDGYVVYEECSNTTLDSFVEFLYHIEKLKSNPRYFIRFSESTSLLMDEPIIKSLQERTVKLTGLSRTLIEKSEPIQVVRYSVFGHYNAHYDTSYGPATKKECCIGKDDTDCHLCRFITIILYLNNVAKGGETAFPVADDANRYYVKNYSLTLNEKCQEANLLIKPRKGTAVMWYNHLLERDGATHMGAIDWLSLHGGCDVIEGVKWIANVWLNAPSKKRKNA